MTVLVPLLRQMRTLEARAIDLTADCGCRAPAARFRVPDAEAANPVILQQLMARGDEVITFQEMPRTLEEVYLAAMTQVNHV